MGADGVDRPQGPLGPIGNPGSDGPPLLVAAPDGQQLVPFAPAPVLTNNIGNVAAGVPFAALFSLPFGLTAAISQPNGPVNPRVRSRFLRRRRDICQPVAGIPADRVGSSSARRCR